MAEFVKLTNHGGSTHYVNVDNIGSVTPSQGMMEGGYIVNMLRPVGNVASLRVTDADELAILSGKIGHPL
jgi:hypothetical protein